MTVAANFLYGGSFSLKMYGKGITRMSKVQNKSMTPPERVILLASTQWPWCSPSHRSQKKLIGVHWKILKKRKPTLRMSLTMRTPAKMRRGPVPVGKMRM